jgi:hypothetical protein
LLAAAAVQPATAQHGHAAPLPMSTAPREAMQFDFLIGQWEIVAQPRISGLAAKIHGSPKFPGIWKAWRAFDGFGIEDEVRLTDRSGNPYALTHTLRIYDRAAQQWVVTALDVYRSKFTTAQGEWRDGAMHVRSQGTDSEGKAWIARTRFHDITATSFRMQQDRSFDDGRTWTEGHLEIEAKRVATVAPR